MSLKLYFKENSTYREVSSVSPITTIHDGKNGDTKSICVYLRNDDNTKWYSNIITSPLDTEEAYPYGDVAYTETGWGVKLKKGSTEPTQAEWDDINWGNQINMDDIGSSGSGDDSTYSPFWFLVSCPPNSEAQNKEDIQLNVSYTENAV